MSCVINCSDIVDGSSQCSWSGECILVASDVDCVCVWVCVYR